jgi:hypothetical protein
MFTHTILTYISLNRVQVHTNISRSTPRLSLNRVQFNRLWALSIDCLPDTKNQSRSYGTSQHSIVSTLESDNGHC